MNRGERFQQVRRGEWKIILLANQGFGKGGRALKSSVMTGQKKKMEKELIERGVNRKVAAQLVAGHPESLIESQIQILDNLVLAKDKRVVKNSAGYLVASIRDNYQPPIMLKNQAKKRSVDFGVPPAQRSPKEIQIEKLQAERDAALDQFLATLTPEQIQELEEVALINGTRMQIESYYRLKPKGGPLFDSLRRQILNDYRLALVTG